MRIGTKSVTTRWAAVGIITAACASLVACGTASDLGADAVPGAAEKASAASTSFPAKVDINGRKHIGDTANAAGSKEDAYKKGQKVRVRCQATADDGSLWIYTKDKYWVPDKFVKTGTDGYAKGVRHCKNDGGGNDGGGKHKDRKLRVDGPAGSKGGSNKEKIERVIKVAKAQTHKGYQYSWGAGGKGGAAYGDPSHYGSGGERSKGPDGNRYGYDCSGLTLHAFWKGAGVDIGDATPQQYQKGKKVSTKHLKRGDMVFWGNGDNAASTEHVAIYLGKGKIVEAAPPRTDNSVHVKDLYGRGDWTSHAIRIFN